MCRKHLITGLMLLLFILPGNLLFAQESFFPCGVYSVMDDDHLDSLVQVHRAGFNVIRAGKHGWPNSAILDSAARYGMKVAFDGGVYVHNYSAAQYNIYEAELEQGDVPDPDHIDWFYWYEHNTGNEFTIVDTSGWYANPNNHSEGYMLIGVFDGHQPTVKDIWHEQMIGENGTDFEAAYRLRIGSIGSSDPDCPVVDLRVGVGVENDTISPHFNPLVNHLLCVGDFTEGQWQTFTVNYHLTDADSERYVQHNLYWHGYKEVWVDRVEVKDLSYGVPLFAGTYDNAIQHEADSLNKIPLTADNTLWRWYLWDEPRRIQFRAQNRVNGLITEATVYRQVPGMTAFFESTDGYPYRSFDEYLAMANPTQLLYDIYPLRAHNGGANNQVLQQELDSLTTGLARAKAIVDGAEPPLELWYACQAHALREWHENGGGPHWETKLRDPSRAEIRCLGYLGLVYGARALFWYTYESRYPSQTPTWWPKYSWNSVEHVDDDRVPGEEQTQPGDYHTLGLVSRGNYQLPATEYDNITEKWYEIQHLNEILDIIGPDLLALTWHHAFCADTTAPAGSIVQAVSDSSIQVGNFTHSVTSEPYFMLVNRRCADPDIQTITVTLENSTNRRLVEDILASRVHWDGNANRVAYRILEPAETQFVVTLNPGEGRLFRVTNGLSGTLPGNRYWSGELFTIDDIEVENTDTLTVEPGTRAELEINKKIKVNGSIQANGSGSFPITFSRSGSSGTWYGIRIENATTNSSFGYCTIEYSGNSIRLESTSGSVTIDHCTLQNNSFGFAAQFSSPYTIRNSTIRYNQYGLWIKSKASSTYSYIQDNMISNNSQHGIYMHLGAFAYFGNNHIYDNTVNGLYCFSSASPYLRGPNGHNWIYSNDQSGVKAQINSFPKLGTNYQGYPNKDYYGYNHIYDNAAYEVENGNGGSNYILAERNYWSASTTNCVWPQHIYGLVDYEPILPLGCDEQSRQEMNIAYELELMEKYQEAIAAYDRQIAANAESDTATFAVGGLVRCYEVLEKSSQVLDKLNELIKQYPKSATDWQAKDNSLPYLEQKRDFDTAIARTYELKNFFQGDKSRDYLYTYVLASIYDSRSDDKAGSDQDLALKYYQELIDKYPESDFANMAKLRIKEITGSGGLFKPGFETEKAIPKIPVKFNLVQNYPNPFNPKTTIQYSIPEPSHVTVQVFNLKGELVQTLVNARQEADSYKITWDGNNESGQAVAAGMYICQLQAGRYNKSIRLVLLK